MLRYLPVIDAKAFCCCRTFVAVIIVIPPRYVSEQGLAARAYVRAGRTAPYP
jgi:hypothetical protein